MPNTQTGVFQVSLSTVSATTNMNNFSTYSSQYGALTYQALNYSMVIQNTLVQTWYLTCQGTGVGTAGVSAGYSKVFITRIA